MLLVAIGIGLGLLGAPIQAAAHGRPGAVGLLLALRGVSDNFSAGLISMRE